LESILTRIAPPEEDCAIFDPCAGEGVGLLMIQKHLGVKPEQTYAIELHADRGEQVRMKLPGAYILSPASFFGCQVAWDAFGMIYLNPPFDHDRDHGRVEIKWLKRATSSLVPGGLMLFVCPEATAKHEQCRAFLCQNYERISVVPFPSNYRKSNEVFVLARKNPKPLSGKSVPSFPSLLVANTFLYRPAPSSGALPYWKKTSLTELEVVEALESSPLNRHLKVPAMRPLPTPPLALNAGQVALLLACGELDGVIDTGDGMPHVIRGTARKVEEITEEHKTKGKSTETTQTTFTERIEMIIRAVDSSGTIHTLE
jgi:hypothetical protein